MQMLLEQSDLSFAKAKHGSSVLYMMSILPEHLAFSDAKFSVEMSHHGAKLSFFR